MTLPRPEALSEALSEASDVPRAAPKVVIVRTGSANIASILAAIARTGATARTTECPRDVATAPAVILPGVGAFGPAMLHLRQRGLDSAITDRIAADLPLLCICVGLQVLADESEESPGIRGLGILPCAVRRFPSSVCAPQMGWNALSPQASASLLSAGYAYFANAYRIESIPTGWSGAMSQHGGPFVAALQRRQLLACQFHPELSGTYGQQLLSRWILHTARAAEVPC